MKRRRRSARRGGWEERYALQRPREVGHARPTTCWCDRGHGFQQGRRAPAHRQVVPAHQGQIGTSGRSRHCLAPALIVDIDVEPAHSDRDPRPCPRPGEASFPMERREEMERLIARQGTMRLAAATTALYCAVLFTVPGG